MSKIDWTKPLREYDLGWSDEGFSNPIPRIEEVAWGDWVNRYEANARIAYLVELLREHQYQYEGESSMKFCVECGGKPSGYEKCSTKFCPIAKVLAAYPRGEEA